MSGKRLSNLPRTNRSCHPGNRLSGSRTRDSTLAIGARTDGAPDGSMSEPTVCRILIAHDLVTSPAFNAIEASDDFHDSEGLPAIGPRARPERCDRTSSGRPVSPV